MNNLIDFPNDAERFQQRLQRIIENDINGVLVLSEEGTIQFANPAAARMFGRSVDDLVGQLFGLPVVVNEMTQIEVLRQGRPCPVEMRITPITWPDEPALLVSLHDLSERIRFEQELSHRNTHDALTDLPAQQLLLEALDQAIYAARRAGTRIALLVLQLNRIAMLNVSLGHAATDALLLEAVRRLQLLQPHTLARIHNEDFVFVMDGLVDDQDITRLTDQLRAVLTDPFDWEGSLLPMEAIAGIAIYPKDATEAAPLLQCAEVALFDSREGGRAGFVYASPELNDRVQHRMANEVALRRGFANGELEMFYQPRVSLSTGYIVGAEALMRWRDPQRGIVPPMEFIPLAEESGLIIPITEWALEVVSRQQKQWLDVGCNPVPVSVNLCGDHFANQNLPATLEAILKESGLPPELLELELTETVAMEHAEKTINQLRAIRGLGVMIALDDFGTGYSSLSYLERFPIDILKVDISFVRGVVNNPDDAAITSAIIAMAHQLGYEVVAEGVEYEAQRKFLADLRCEEGQGYLFSKPVTSAEFGQLLHGCWCYPGQPPPEVAEPIPTQLVLLDASVARRHLLQQFLQQSNFEVYACALPQEVKSCVTHAAISILLLRDDIGTDAQELLDDLAAHHPELMRVMLAPPASLSAMSALADHRITHILSTALPPQRQLNFLRKLIATQRGVS